MDQLQKLQLENQNLTSKYISTAISKPTTEGNQQIKELKDKIAIADANLSKIRKQKEEAENGTKRHSNLLRRELGPNIIVENLIKDQSGWKGRDEIICKLKNKISELQSKVNEVSIQNTSEEKSMMSSTKKSTKSMANEPKKRELIDKLTVDIKTAVYRLNSKMKLNRQNQS